MRAALIPRVRRLLKPLSSVLLVVGVLLAADAVITLLWKEPLSAIYAQVQQGKLDDGLAKLEGTEPNATDRKVLSHLDGLDRKLAYAARALNRRTDDGQPLGRIRMRKIGRTSATYECAAYRVEDDVLRVTATQTLVLVDLAERRARTIPGWYRDAIRGFEDGDCEIAAA